MGCRIIGWLIFAGLTGTLWALAMAQENRAPLAAARQPREWRLRFQIPRVANPLYYFPPGCVVDTATVQVIDEVSQHGFRQVDEHPQRGEFCLRSNRIVFSPADSGKAVVITFRATSKRVLVLTPVNLSPLAYLSETARQQIEQELTHRGYELIPESEAVAILSERRISPDWLLLAAHRDTVPKVAELAKAMGFDMLVVVAVKSHTNRERRYELIVRRDPDGRTRDVETYPYWLYETRTDCDLVLYDGATGRVLMRRSLSDKEFDRGRKLRKRMLTNLIQTAFRDFFRDSESPAVPVPRSMTRRAH